MRSQEIAFSLLFVLFVVLFSLFSMCNLKGLGACQLEIALLSATGAKLVMEKNSFNII